MLRQATGTIEVSTPGQGLLEVTARVRDWSAARGMRDGLLTVFCRHTSALMLTQKNTMS